MDYDGKRCQYKEQVRGLQEQRENFSQSVDQNNFTGEFYQIFKEVLTILHKPFWKN